MITEQDLHEYNKWLMEVWNPNQLYIPFGIDAPKAYLTYKTKVENLDIPRVINWVAVKDELPNKGEEVLTITEDGWYRVMTFGSTGRRFPAQVTHWQKLPEPPCL